MGQRAQCRRPDRRQHRPDGPQNDQTYGEQLQWSAIDDAAEETGRIELDLARRVTSLRTQAGSFAAEYTATGLVRSQVVDGEATEFAYTPGAALRRRIRMGAPPSAATTRPVTSWLSTMAVVGGRSTVTVMGG